MQYHEMPKGTKLNWLSGKPPKAGWYMASIKRNSDCWRWWNGYVWSLDVFSYRSAAFAAARAKKPSKTQSSIKYTMYYPANARVARPA